MCVQGTKVCVQGTKMGVRELSQVLRYSVQCQRRALLGRDEPVRVQPLAEEEEAEEEQLCSELFICPLPLKVSVSLTGNTHLLWIESF